MIAKYYGIFDVTVDTTFNCVSKLYHLYLYCRCGITWGNCDMCYLECSYVEIVIVIVPYGGEGHVAATELQHLGGCMSTQKIVRQEEFFTQGIQEKIIFKILSRVVSYATCFFFLSVFTKYV